VCDAARSSMEAETRRTFVRSSAWINTNARLFLLSNVQRVNHPEAAWFQHLLNWIPPWIEDKLAKESKVLTYDTRQSGCYRGEIVEISEGLPLLPSLGPVRQSCVSRLWSNFLYAIPYLELRKETFSSCSSFISLSICLWCCIGFEQPVSKSNSIRTADIEETIELTRRNYRARDLTARFEKHRLLAFVKNGLELWSTKRSWTTIKKWSEQHSGKATRLV
jgi:hypothetical protein